MRTVTAEELEKHARDILTQLEQNGEVIEIASNDKVIAHIIPVHQSERRQAVKPFLEEVDRLAAEIGAYLPERVDAVEAVRDIRREL